MKKKVKTPVTLVDVSEKFITKSGNTLVILLTPNPSHSLENSRRVLRLQFQANKFSYPSIIHTCSFDFTDSPTTATSATRKVKWKPEPKRIGASKRSLNCLWYFLLVCSSSLLVSSVLLSSLRYYMYKICFYWSSLVFIIRLFGFLVAGFFFSEAEIEDIRIGERQVWLNASWRLRRWFTYYHSFSGSGILLSPLFIWSFHKALLDLNSLLILQS